MYIKGHCSQMVTLARLESGICKDPGFAPASVYTYSLLCSQRIRNWIALSGKTGTQCCENACGCQNNASKNAQRP